jgi:hypothetical protein
VLIVDRRHEVVIWMRVSEQGSAIESKEAHGRSMDQGEDSQIL